jgi:hypothetical protein
MTSVAAEWAVHSAVPRRRTIRPARAVCRLTIAINGTDYEINPSSAEAGAVLKAYRLSKADGTAYDVAEHISPSQGEMSAGQRGGRLTPTPALPHRMGERRWITCDCPDFIFRRDGIDPGGCKHIQAMVAYGLLDREGAIR